MQGIQQWAFSQEHEERLRLGYKQVLHNSQLWQTEQLRQVSVEFRGKPGIYFWVLAYQGKFHRIYVGKAKSLGYRIQNYAGHFQPHSPNDFKLQVFYEFAKGNFAGSELAMYFFPCSIGELIAHENNEIAAFTPLLNSRMQASSEARASLQEAFAQYYQSGFMAALSGS